MIDDIVTQHTLVKDNDPVDVTAYSMARATATRVMTYANALEPLEQWEFEILTPFIAVDARRSGDDQPPPLRLRLVLRNEDVVPMLRTLNTGAVSLDESVGRAVETSIAARKGAARG
jgi:hypothetical protein